MPTSCRAFVVALFAFFGAPGAQPWPDTRGGRSRAAPEPLLGLELHGEGGSAGFVTPRLLCGRLTVRPEEVGWCSIVVGVIEFRKPLIIDREVSLLIVVEVRPLECLASRRSGRRVVSKRP